MCSQRWPRRLWDSGNGSQGMERVILVDLDLDLDFRFTMQKSIKAWTTPKKHKLRLFRNPRTRCALPSWG